MPYTDEGISSQVGQYGFANDFVKRRVAQHFRNVYRYLFHQHFKKVGVAFNAFKKIVEALEIIQRIYPVEPAFERGFGIRCKIVSIEVKQFF